MKIICHRGRTDGDVDSDNHPDQIKYCLYKGFDSEIDLWVVNNHFLLGHDYPNYLISQDFLLSNSDRLWIHCKNFDALIYCNSIRELNYFWHQEDDYTLTSKNIIWTYPGKMVQNKNQVVLDFSKTPQIDKYKHLDYYGVCVDYV